MVKWHFISYAMLLRPRWTIWAFRATTFRSSAAGLRTILWSLCIRTQPQQRRTSIKRRLMTFLWMRLGFRRSEGKSHIKVTRLNKSKADTRFWCGKSGCSNPSLSAFVKCPRCVKIKHLGHFSCLWTWKNFPKKEQKYPILSPFSGVVPTRVPTKSVPTKRIHLPSIVLNFSQVRRFYSAFSWEPLFPCFSRFPKVKPVFVCCKKWRICHPILQLNNALSARFFDHEKPGFFFARSSEVMPM